MDKKSNSKNTEKNFDRSLTLIQYYVQLMWLVFGAFLLVETVLLGSISTLLKDGEDIWIFYGSILGLILTIPWYHSFKYYHSLYLLNLDFGLKFEPENSPFLSQGGKLVKGERVKNLKLFKELKISRITRLFSPKNSVLTLIFIFCTTFIIISICYFPFNFHVCGE